MDQFIVHVLIELAAVLLSGAITAVVGLVVRTAFRTFRAGIDESLAKLGSAIADLAAQVKEMREMAGDHAVKIGINTEAIRQLREEHAEFRRAK